MANGFLSRTAPLGSLRAFLGAPTLGDVQATGQREKIRIAALQAALENLPIDAPNRPELEASLGQLTGEPTIGMAFRPKPPEAAGGFTLGAAQGRFEPDPTGQPQLVAAGPRFTPEESGGGDPRFGRSQSGLAMDIVVRARNKQRQGIPLTPEDRDNLAFARNVLNSPRVIQGPGGSLIQVEPVGIPAQLEPVFDEAPEDLGRTRGGQAVERVSQQERTGQFKITQLRGATDIAKDFDTVLNISDEINTLLLEGRQEFGGITGAVGTAKAVGGGAARQLGIPVSGRAKSLKRKLETVKAIAAAHVLGESGRTLSDQDRARLDQIVGTLDVLTDEQDIREALIDVVELMNKMVE